MALARLSIAGLMKASGFNRKKVKHRILRAGIKPTNTGDGNRLYDYSVLNVIMKYHKKRKRTDE